MAGKIQEFLAGALPNYQAVMGNAQNMEGKRLKDERAEEAYNQLQEQMQGNKDFAKQLYDETQNSGRYTADQLASLPDYNGISDPNTYLTLHAQWTKKSDDEIRSGKVSKAEQAKLGATNEAIKIISAAENRGGAISALGEAGLGYLAGTKAVGAAQDQKFGKVANVNVHTGGVGRKGGSSKNLRKEISDTAKALSALETRYVSSGFDPEEAKAMVAETDLGKRYVDLLDEEKAGKKPTASGLGAPPPKKTPKKAPKKTVEQSKLSVSGFADFKKNQGL